MKKTLLSIFSLCLGACQSAPSDHTQRSLGERTLRSFGDSSFEVSLNIYQAEKPSEKAVIIFPPTGGSTYLERRYAQALYRAGFDVYLIERWTGQDEKAIDLRLHDRLYQKSLRALRLILDQTPSKFIGVLGTSVGGTHVAVAMSQIPRLNAGFSIAGGAPIPAIIVKSDQKAMIELRQKRFEKMNFKSDEEYLAALEKEFPLDPFKAPTLFAGKDLGLSVATEDTTVPTKFQKTLQELWQSKTVYEINSGHFWGIVKTWWFHQDDIVRFFIESSNKK